MARRKEEKPELTLHLKEGNLRQSISDVVYETLLEAILSQELPGSTPLFEAQLAEQFNVSKTPIREAIQRLSQTGLVDYERARGATVHMLTRDEIQDIFEMRCLLEPLALRQSATHITRAEIARLDDVLNQAQHALDAENYRLLSLFNTEFHRSIVANATNTLLLRWLDSLGHRRRLISLQGWAIENRSQREQEEHREILHAIRDNDIDHAVHSLTQHITRFAQIVLDNHPEPEEKISS